MLNIQITDTAAQQMRTLMEKAPADSKSLRLSIKATGCSGNSYKMEYVDKDEDESADDIVQSGDVCLHIPKTVSWMLIGMKIDYVTDNLGNSKFEFINPNEAGRCGCGESFQIEKRP